MQEQVAPRKLLTYGGESYGCEQVEKCHYVEKYKTGNCLPLAVLLTF